MEGVRATVAWGALAGLLTITPSVAQSRRSNIPEVCKNPHLIEAMQILDGACQGELCDFDILAGLDTEVERKPLLGALRSPYLRPTHLFFPTNLYEISDIWDWETTKEDQLYSLRYMENPNNSIVYVIGKASNTGEDDHNRRLSYSRMKSVLEYLETTAELSICEIRVGYLGEQALQFTLSDAAMLNIPPQDYRDNELTLNQSVYVFVFPCKDMLD